jgi:hypothetical protein
VRDAWFIPPPPDDAAWFNAHPHRLHRARPLHPDDTPYVPYQCQCTDHAWCVIVGKLGKHLLAIRVPANDKWPPDDEGKLCRIFAHFVFRDPRLLLAAHAMLEEEE